MIEVELSRELQVAAHAAFAYVTDIAHWHDFFPGFVRLAPAARWRAPGDRATVISRVLHVEKALHMTLVEHAPAERVRFLMCQRGLPDIEHVRTFTATDSGCRIHFAARYEPRTGLVGLLDRVVVRRVLERGFVDAATAIGGHLNGLGLQRPVVAG